LGPGVRVRAFRDAARLTCTPGPRRGPPSVGRTFGSGRFAPRTMVRTADLWVGDSAAVACATSSSRGAPTSCAFGSASLARAADDARPVVTKLELTGAFSRDGEVRPKLVENGPPGSGSPRPPRLRLTSRVDHCQCGSRRPFPCPFGAVPGCGATYLHPWSAPRTPSVGRTFGSGRSGGQPGEGAPLTPIRLQSPAPDRFYLFSPAIPALPPNLPPAWSRRGAETCVRRGHRLGSRRPYLGPHRGPWPVHACSVSGWSWPG
jgi:hypothetical protein